MSPISPATRSMKARNGFSLLLTGLASNALTYFSLR
jgi:hypothetical protein